MHSKAIRYPVRYALCVPVLLALALGACRREEPAPSATPQAEAAAVPAEAPAATTEHVDPPKIAGTDAIAVSENTSADATTQGAASTVAGVDSKDFAGRFATQGTTIQLNADGTYAMTAGAESGGGDVQYTGTWSVEAGGKQLLLDSDNKAEPDRRYAVVSKDELKASEGGQSLRREGMQ